MQEFENNLNENLLQLRSELLMQTYKPKPLETFIIRDPKTRKISKSDFRDRVVHHALCNIIEPVFEKSFIYDSYANRLGKGTRKALERFDLFKRQASKNNRKECFVLKADIKHYFETVNHAILLSAIRKKIHDARVLWLIEAILANHHTTTKGQGMPLGNLTSQFFANVYLNELDQFVKHTLKAKQYIRYVDDFIILDSSKQRLADYKIRIDFFLTNHLALQLHPDKSKIIPLASGVTFLGFRIFYYHTLVRKKNLDKFSRKIRDMKKLYEERMIEREKVIDRFQGFLAYIKHANTYKYQRKLTRAINTQFPVHLPMVVRNVKKHVSFTKKVEQSETEFSEQKTLQLFRKGKTIPQIAQLRGIKEVTIWKHLASLIEHNKIRVDAVVLKEKITKILRYARIENSSMKEIKEKINDPMIIFDEIACVLATIKAKNKKHNIFQLVQWYKRTNCAIKCHTNRPQREVCNKKFEGLCSNSPQVAMALKTFLYLFNNDLTICVLPEQEKRRYISWKDFLKKRTDVAVVVEFSQRRFQQYLRMSFVIVEC